MRIRLILLVLAMMLLTLTACAEPAPPSQADVVETVSGMANVVALAASAWRVEMLGSPGNELPLIEGSTPTLNFFVERYAGFSGCNYYLAAYSIDGNSISMLGPNTSILQCAEPDGVMEQESTFIGVLQNATEFALDGDTLTLLTVGEQPLATLVRTPNLPLEGTTWLLKFYVADGEIVPLIDGTAITAQFEGDQLSGSAGCNDYTATATIDGSNLTVSPAAATMMACEAPNGVMEQEMAYLAQLENAASYDSGGSTLIIANAEGDAIMLFAAQE